MNKVRRKEGSAVCSSTIKLLGITQSMFPDEDKLPVIVNGIVKKVVVSGLENKESAIYKVKSLGFLGVKDIGDGAILVSIGCTL